MDEFDPEKFTDMLDLLGREGKMGIDRLRAYLNDTGRDGDMYVEEALAQLEELIPELYDD